MFRFALHNLLRRRLRNFLALAGVALAVAVLAALSAFSHGYERALRVELERMDLHLMLVPLGCPYDAAARVLKGSTLESSLPESALEVAQKDPDVEIAAPLLMVAVSREEEARADVWAGVDEKTRLLKPWWKARSGAAWFTSPESVILGQEAAEVEMRVPGDRLFSPETGRNFSVAGVLERSGTSDDSLFFIPLKTAQGMFNQTGRLTAIAVRLRDPAALRQASDRLQNIPGVQVVTLTEMIGTFLNLVGAMRTLSNAITIVAIAVSLLGVLNTLLAAVVERTGELSLLRALGASRSQVFRLLAIEALLLTGCGSVAGLLLAQASGRAIEDWVRRVVPFAPHSSMLDLTLTTAVQCLALVVLAGLTASLYPAWQASRAQPAAALKEF